ncbi:hypothetical protein ACHHRT_13710, partial [Desulfurivibrio sp. D14AmB]|uniref:hypothetical protein n=1 Tax=Desulfurivibrio sp. D14AmB TaxID=3374370 RepID=UPI00376F3AFE
DVTADEDQKVVAKLRNQGYVTMTLNQEEPLGDHDKLVERAVNLAREMKIDIDLLRKWHIKAKLANISQAKKVAVLGVRGADDRATLYEVFGPSFSMLPV